MYIQIIVAIASAAFALKALSIIKKHLNKEGITPLDIVLCIIAVIASLFGVFYMRDSWITIGIFVFLVIIPILIWIMATKKAKRTID